MIFIPITENHKISRAIVYVNKRCPSYDFSDNETLKQWINNNSHNIKLYQIKHNGINLGYLSLIIKGTVLHVETIYIYPSKRNHYKYIDNVFKFCLRLCEENNCDGLSCNTILHGLAKILVEKHNFNLTYNLKKNVK